METYHSLKEQELKLDNDDYETIRKRRMVGQAFLEKDSNAVVWMAIVFQEE
jgi:hypothetical protein